MSNVYAGILQMAPSPGSTLPFRDRRSTGRVPEAAILTVWSDWRRFHAPDSWLPQVLPGSGAWLSLRSQTSSGCLPSCRRQGRSTQSADPTQDLGEDARGTATSASWKTT